MWHSLVARFVRDEEAAGSNPVIPTIYTQLIMTILDIFRYGHFVFPFYCSRLKNQAAFLLFWASIACAACNKMFSLVYSTISLARLASISVDIAAVVFSLCVVRFWIV